MLARIMDLVQVVPMLGDQQVASVGPLVRSIENVDGHGRNTVKALIRYVMRMDLLGRKGWVGWVGGYDGVGRLIGYSRSRGCLDSVTAGTSVQRPSIADVGDEARYMHYVLENYKKLQMYCSGAIGPISLTMDAFMKVHLTSKAKCFINHPHRRTEHQGFLDLLLQSNTFVACYNFLTHSVVEGRAQMTKEN
jgi:hypothetical protein